MFVGLSVADGEPWDNTPGLLFYKSTSLKQVT